MDDSMTMIRQKARDRKSLFASVSLASKTTYLPICLLPTHPIQVRTCKVEGSSETTYFLTSIWL